ncbi:MAG: HEPN domain-containing protein [Chloroflexi bacterium]|nr:HEPN domain-containing protein [Chloroflexota bacterium]
MIDVDKQIAYWRNSSLEDWEVAQELITLERTRHGLFFAHLSVEKMLKAHICQQSKELPPKIHNLLVLGEKANLPLSNRQKIFLGRFDQYQIEGRYATTLLTALVKARQEMAEAAEFLQWLIKQF